MPTKTPDIRKVTDEASQAAIIQTASALLQQGGVTVCATDTGYLLGVDGLNLSAVEKVYKIKGRSFNKPIHVVVSDVKMAHTLVEMDARAKLVFQHFLPGPLTLILPRKPCVPDLLVSGLAGLGLRIPENAFLLQLVKTSGVPITATSANRSGYGTPYSVEQVLEELGPAVKYVDLIIDQGDTQHAMPSTILNMTTTPPTILRQGPITADMLHEKGIL